MQAFCVGHYMEVPTSKLDCSSPLHCFYFDKYFCLDVCSPTRRRSPHLTSAVCPLHSSTQRGTWVCCWVCMHLTWARAPLCLQWKLSVPVSLIQLKPRCVEIQGSVLTVNFLLTAWLQSSIFSGGLQTSQIHYNYNEEKDEDHCSSLGSTTPDKAKLYSRRITLSDHAQPFLQAIADNTTQDHSVKVQAETHGRSNGTHQFNQEAMCHVDCLFSFISGLSLPNRAML